MTADCWQSTVIRWCAFYALLCMPTLPAAQATTYGECCVPDGTLNAFYIELTEPEYCCACPPLYYPDCHEEPVLIAWNGWTIGYRCGNAEDCASVEGAIPCDDPLPLQKDLSWTLYSSTVTDIICEQCDYLNGCLVTHKQAPPITYMHCDCSIEGCVTDPPSP